MLIALSEAPDRRLCAYELSDALGWEKSRLRHPTPRGRRAAKGEPRSHDNLAIGE